MRAKNNKGLEVINVMAYRRKDAMRFVIREYESIKRLVKVCDIDNL